LGNVYLMLEAAVIVKTQYLTQLVGTARMVAQLAIAGVGVGGIGNHGAAVGGAAFRKKKIGAGKSGRVLQAEQHKQTNREESFFH
jgi:hypothetical protein